MRSLPFSPAKNPHPARVSTPHARPRRKARRFEEFEARRLLAVINHAGEISIDETWSGADVHVLTGDVTVKAGATLTLQPGAVVKGSHFTHDLIVDGALDARGTVAAPIVFTSIHDDTAGGDTNNNAAATLPAPFSWGGIVLRGAGNVLEHTEVRYGSSGQVTVRGGELSLTDSTIRHAAGTGLRIENSDPTIANVTFANNTGAAASMDLASNPTITGVSFTNNATNGLTVDSGTLGKDGFWDDPDIVYVPAGDIVVPAGLKLTVGAGQIDHQLDCAQRRPARPQFPSHR